MRTPGLLFANPFLTKKRISLRVRNFETGKLKVNDNALQPDRDRRDRGLEGVDTAEALFEVDELRDVREVQSESALRDARHRSTPTTRTTTGEVSLRGHTGRGLQS